MMARSHDTVKPQWAAWVTKKCQEPLPHVPYSLYIKWSNYMLMWFAKCRKPLGGGYGKQLWGYSPPLKAILQPVRRQNGTLDFTALWWVCLPPPPLTAQANFYIHIQKGSGIPVSHIT